MARVGWSRIWRKDTPSLSLAGTVARMAAAGEETERLVELTARCLLEVSQADRGAVWLFVEGSEQLDGVVLDTASSDIPDGWRRPVLPPVLMEALARAAEPLVVDRRRSPWAASVASLQGMRTAVWIPLRIQRRLLGAACLAYAAAEPPADLEPLQTLADELAVGVAQRRDHARAAAASQELDALEQMQRLLSSNLPPQQLLAAFAEQAMRYLQADFLAVALTPGEDEVDWKSFHGPNELASFRQDSRLRAALRGALERDGFVGLSPDEMEASDGSPAGQECQPLAFVGATPFKVRGITAGVLLVGFTSMVAAPPVEAKLRPLAVLAGLAVGLGPDAALHFQRIEADPDAEPTSEMVLAFDKDGILHQATPAASESLGLSVRSVGGRKLEDAFAEEHRSRIASWRQAAVCRPVSPLEVAMPNGTVLRLAVTGHSNRLCRVVVKDITALQALEKKCVRVEAELASLLESVPAGVLLVDRSGRVRYINDRFTQMFGVDPRRSSDLDSLENLAVMVKDRFREPEAFAAHWKQIHLAGDEASIDELEMVRPMRKVLERFARPVIDHESRRVGWLEVYRDLTNQRSIQNKLVHTEKMAALGQLVSGIAHELNNPLTSIMGYAQLLLSRRLKQDRISDAEKIYQEAERAGRLVKNLLLFARGTKPERKPVDLNEIVERTLALRSYELKVENISIDVELDPELPRTLADAHQLQQVILNLLVNAEQALHDSGGSGRISLRTHHIPGNRIALEVADDGPGIPPGLSSRIFDPFFTTKPLGVGTGLGLSIAYGIVQEHGGEIYADSVPGRGATFVVELPVTTAEEQATVLTPVGRLADRAARPGRRILVVEDEATVAQLVVDVLTELGHQVEACLDSEEGLHRATHEDYDLVICDLRMPRLDGRGFYQALVESESPVRDHLLFITGDTLAPRTLDFLSTHHIPYVAKPFLVEELTSAVNQLLNAANGSRATPTKESNARLAQRSGSVS